MCQSAGPVRRWSIVFLTLLTGLSVQAAELYFPPTAGPWESVSPEDALAARMWLADALDYAMTHKSSSVVILHRGRILAERHQPVMSPSLRYRGTLRGTTTAGHVVEDVASCQKSVTSVLVGIAQEKGLLKIDDPVSLHLGSGWSQASAEQERAIKIRHLLSMTSGLDERLQFVAPAGTRWAYNTAAYARTLTCVVRAAGKDRNTVTREWLTGPTGMTHTKWVERRIGRKSATTASPAGLVTTGRDLARFGLLMLANGRWGEKVVIGDPRYLRAATSPSQQLNPSYGFLWWLNGQEFVLRGNRRIRGPMIPEAPLDLYAALGALGRKCYVVPGEQLVVVRLGDSPGSAREGDFNREFWKRLSKAIPKLPRAVPKK